LPPDPFEVAPAPAGFHSIVKVATPSISELESEERMLGINTSRSSKTISEISIVTSVAIGVDAGSVNVNNGVVSSLRVIVITRSAVIALRSTPIARTPCPGS
jgi:hypothetical protein